jgi:hypothetical protein
MLSGRTRVDDHILNCDPEFPDAWFGSAAIAAAFTSAGERLPSAVSRPSGKVPAAAAQPAPNDCDDLTRFRGYEAVVVTWTAAETTALATLFNDRGAGMAHSYDGRGLCLPCTIGSARVLLFKSGLQLDCGGPEVPVRELMIEIIEAVQPKLLITAGTGGRSEVAVGDVVIATRARFNRPTPFEQSPWTAASHATTASPAAALAANPTGIPGARPIPTIWADTREDVVVTTDFFGVDASTVDHKLQRLGRAGDTGGAMVGNAMRDCSSAAWYAVRNPCDPQIAGPTGGIAAAAQTAAHIYAEWGPFTTAASAIVTRAIIDAAFNEVSEEGTEPRL